MRFVPFLAALALTGAEVHSASLPTSNVSIQFVITARPPILQSGELTVSHGKTPVRVTQLDRLDGARSNLQLYVLLDDSTRTAGLGTQLPELRKFVAALPASTQVAVGYMRNGAAVQAHAFTTDHAAAAAALRLPEGIPGANGSPYFALEDLMEHWPSNSGATRRVVLMLTDGVDRYYTSQIEEDPYAEAANVQALKHGVQVYSIYLRGAGIYGRGLWQTTIAQSRLLEASEQTGGYAYFQAFTDPVSVAPFLQDFAERLSDQYLVTIDARNEKGLQSIKINAEAPGVKVEGPSKIWAPQIGPVKDKAKPPAADFTPHTQ